MFDKAAKSISNVYRQIKSKPHYVEFLSSINKVFIFKIIVYLISTVIVVIAARILTPAQFGRTGVINSISSLLFVPMLLNVHSSMYKFLPSADEKEKDKLILTSALGSIVSILVFTVIFLLAYDPVIRRLNIPSGEWQMAVALTVFVSFATITEAFLRGQKKFDAICLFKLTAALANLALILVFFFILQLKNLETYVYGLMVFNGLFTLLALFKTGFRKFSAIRWPVVKKIYAFSFSNFLSMLLSGIIFSSDIFFVNYFCSSTEVGIYTAYQGFAKNVFSVLFYEIFLVVFLPFLAKADRNSLEKKLKRFTPLIVAAIILCSGIMTTVFILLFGQKYVLNPAYIALSALGIALCSVYQLYVYLYNIEGSKKAMYTGLSTLFALPFTMAAQYFLVSRFGIVGALSSVVLTYFILIVAMIAVNTPAAATPAESNPRNNLSN
jgi:O-antigen/teichoic acid export membrane protein